MRNNHKTYCVFLDVASHPQMYGITEFGGRMAFAWDGYPRTSRR